MYRLRIGLQDEGTLFKAVERDGKLWLELGIFHLLLGNPDIEWSERLEDKK